MRQPWEPKCLGTVPRELSDKEYKLMVAELAEILYELSRSRQLRSPISQPSIGPKKIDDTPPQIQGLKGRSASNG
jgi:hypothetical protein